MNCTDCIYELSCSVRSFAPDITGCEGHSKLKPEVEEAIRKMFEGVSNKHPLPQRTYSKMEDFKIGDKVRACDTTGTRIPTYLEGCVMIVVGFTTKNVKCDLGDGGKLFHIPPENLRKVVFS